MTLKSKIRGITQRQEDRQGLTHAGSPRPLGVVVLDPFLGTMHKIAGDGQVEIGSGLGSARWGCGCLARRGGPVTLDGLSLGLGVLALIAFVVLFALLHPDPKRRTEALKILDRLLSVVPWQRVRQSDKTQDSGII